MLRTPLPSSNERREWPRYVATPKLPLSVEADGMPHPCALENLSLGGACLSFLEGKVPDDTDLKLKLPEIGVIGLRRCWRSGQLAGVFFDYSDASLTFVQDCLQQFMLDGDERSAAMA